MPSHDVTSVIAFLACGELLGWLGHQDVRRKQWKVCNWYPIVSSSAGAFMHSIKWSLRML